jgi:hypothetical protein
MITKQINQITELALWGEIAHEQWAPWAQWAPEARDCTPSPVLANQKPLPWETYVYGTHEDGSCNCQLTIVPVQQCS